MNQYELLIKEIKEYDSDTFFAKGCDLRDKEAIKLADKCIEWFINNRLDGVMLDHFLDELREEETEN
jgi:hypothetical protein